LRPTADSCLELGVVDVIVPEPSGGAHRDHARASELLGDAVAVELEFLNSLPSAERRRLRRQKFERMGAFVE
jgi:acetyl-CoA carboxylase carboxyl transferase subunit alpha